MKSVKIVNRNTEFQVGKIVCVGRNYAAHAKELGNEIPSFPIIFLKPASDIIFSGEKVVHPDYSENLHHEVELVLLIGKRTKDADNESAEMSVAGYGVGLDMTLRDLQNEFKEKGQPWTLAKCFDTSAVLSEFISAEDYKLTGTEHIWLNVNDDVRQDASLDQMIFSPVDVIKYISHRMTLEEGDLIFTGTPSGVGRVRKGDKISAGIDGIGKIFTEIN